MQNHWDERYSSPEYIYGTEPNRFLKEQLKGIEAGKILFPAEGEGRNAVFAATLGWQTDAFDQSIEGQKKALQLAKQKGVSIQYSIQSLEDWNPESGIFDCIVLIFVHMPEELRKKVHTAAIRALKSGGSLILEAFTAEQLKNTSGGPKTTDLLFTKEMLETDFMNLKVIELKETKRTLDEGRLHQGVADVIQFIGTKP